MEVTPTRLRSAAPAQSTRVSGPGLRPKFSEAHRVAVFTVERLSRWVLHAKGVVGSKARKWPGTV